MGGPVSTGFKLPAEFYEMLGDYRAALRAVKTDLKAAEAEAKEVLKRGGTVDKATQRRIAGMHSRMDSLQARVNEQRAAKAARGGGINLMSRVGQIYHGGLSGRGAALQDLGGWMVGRGGRTARAGMATARAGAFLQGAAVAAGPVALAGYAAWRGVNSVADAIRNENDLRRHAAEGDSQIYGQMAKMFAGARAGDHFSADRISSMRRGVETFGARAAGIVQRGTVSGRARAFLGMAPSREESDAATKAQQIEIKRNLLGRQYGPGFERMTSVGGVAAKYGRQIQRQVERDRETFLDGILGTHSERPLHLIKDIAMGGAVTKAEQEAQIQKWQEKAIEAFERHRELEKERYDTSLEKAVARVEAHERVRQIRRLEEDRIRRHDSWSSL